MTEKKFDAKEHFKSKKQKLLEKMQEEYILNVVRTRPILENNLFKFNRFILEIEEGEGKCKMAQVHLDMGRFIDDNKHKKKLLLIPRGHLKSTFTTVGRTLQAICADPSIRVLIANATYNLACTFLGEVKKHLRTNRKIQDFWGDMASDPEVWSKNEITLNRERLLDKNQKAKSYGKKEPTVTAMGIESNLTSQHYDLIILDDLVNKDYVNTSEQIQKTINFYKECLNLLEPNGELIMIGTRWHDMDLYGWILDKENNILPDFRTFIKQAYSGDLDDPKCEMLFPEKFDAKHLKKLREQQGPYHFSCQYLNDPVSPEDADFKVEWFSYYEPNDLKGLIINNFVTVDPALSEDTRADFTAIVTTGVDQYNNIYIRNIIRKKMSPSELNEELFKLWLEYKPLIMGVEDVAYQKVLRYSLLEEMKKRGVYLPIRELKPGGRAKDQRIRGLQPLYANKRIHHARIVPNIKNLEDELLRFPFGTHDDVIDALAYGNDIWFAPGKRVSKRGHKGKFLYNFNS